MISYLCFASLNRLCFQNYLLAYLLRNFMKFVYLASREARALWLYVICFCCPLADAVNGHAKQPKCTENAI